MTSSYLFLFAIVASASSFLICYLATRYLIQYLTKTKMTVMDYHKDSKPQIPRPGGPAIIVAIVVGELILFILTGSLAVLGIMLVTLISGSIGIVDDLKTLGGIIKPALLVLGGIPLIALQYLVPNATVFDPHLYLPLYHVPTHLPLLYPLLIIVAIPVVTNTINTIDVLNGVVSGFILIAFIPVTLAIILRILDGISSPVILAAVLPIISASIAFYLFHKFPSKIFPGDSGAMALGAAYGAMAIIGGVEVVAVIAILPAIMNSFFFLSSVKRLVEHRQIKSQPTFTLDDNKIIASKDSKAPITLMRLLVSTKAKTEKEIGLDILKLCAFSSFLAILTALMTWVVTIG